MLACRIHAKDDLRIDAVDTPEVGPGQVLLRLGAGGICGSDIHYYYEGRNGSFIVREPLIPGHEASATVVAIGPGVTRVKAGDKVGDPGEGGGHPGVTRLPAVTSADTRPDGLLVTSHGARMFPTARVRPCGSASRTATTPGTIRTP